MNIYTMQQMYIQPYSINLSSFGFSEKSFFRKYTKKYIEPIALKFPKRNISPVLSKAEEINFSCRAKSTEGTIKRVKGRKEAVGA